MYYSGARVAFQVGVHRHRRIRYDTRRRVLFILFGLSSLIGLFYDTVARADDEIPPAAPVTAKLSPFIYWNLGLVLGQLDCLHHDPDAAVMGAVNVEVGHLHFSARLSEATELKLSGTPGTSVNEYSLLAGFVTRFGPGRFFADAGIGVAHATRLASADYSGRNGAIYEMATTTTANLPLQVGISAASRLIGGGWALVANVNSAATFVGVFFFVDVGKLR